MIYGFLFTSHVIICQLIIIIKIIRQKVLIMILFIKKTDNWFRRTFTKKFYKKGLNENLMLPYINIWRLSKFTWRWDLFRTWFRDYLIFIMSWHVLTSQPWGFMSTVLQGLTLAAGNLMNYWELENRGCNIKPCCLKEFGKELWER